MSDEKKIIEGTVNGNDSLSENKVQIDYDSDNKALPEVHIAGNADVEEEQKEKDAVQYENLAFPELHFKK